MKNLHRSIPIILWACGVFVGLPLSGLLSAQTPTAVQVELARQQLERMSSEQIEGKIKEYGMTREEAEAKAKALGIDLESYLKNAVPMSQHAPAPTVQSATPAVTTVTVSTPQTVPENTPAVQTPLPLPVRKPDPDDDRYYGYSLFRSSPGTFEPRPYIDEQYVLGEGDVVKISLSGELQSYNEYTVNTEGRITMQGIAPVLVSGLTVERAKKVVMNALGASYSGILKSPPTIFMDLSVARIRPVRVFITGEVASPGGYAVSNFGSVFNSLFSVGGPKISGSLRDVRVIRNNKVISRVDLYDYLFGTVKGSDVRVNDNDIIFVPLRGKTVSINGEVLRPSTYELLPGENLKKLMEFAGGFRSNIYIDRVQVDRVIPFTERVRGGLDRKVFDIDFRDIVTGKKDYTVEDGDIITVYPILTRKENYVILVGDVRRPGRYQIDKVKTVKDLIQAADGLWPTAYLKRSELFREFPNEQRQMFVIDLEKALANDPSQNLVLQPRDSIKIYNTQELNPAAAVSFQGHVKLPGEYRYADSMTIGRMLRSIGGLEDSLYRAKTFMGRGDIYRLNDDLITRRQMRFDPDGILSGKVPDVAVVPGDQVRMYAINEIQFPDRTVEIFGNVKNPGRYPMSDLMTVSDLILLAGGYTMDAWTQYGEIARMVRKARPADSIITITFPTLPDLFDTTRSVTDILNSKEGAFLLQNLDQLFIRSYPDYVPQKHITIEGRVRYPGKYSLAKKNEHLSDLIMRAGGIYRDGYARGGMVVRSGERMRTNVQEALADPGGDCDIVLQEGDVISIPRSPNTVRVQGEVGNPGLYAYVAGESQNFYVEQAGDLTDSADYVMNTLPEGYTTRSDIHWYWSDNPEIPDGTTITVVKMKPDPPKTEEQIRRTTFTEIFKETTSIIATTLTILVLAKQIK